MMKRISHLGGNVLIVLGCWKSLGYNLLDLVLLGLGVIGLHLLRHRHAVLAPPELVIQLGVVQSQGDEGGELGDQLLVLLIIIINVANERLPCTAQGELD